MSPEIDLKDLKVTLPENDLILSQGQRYSPNAIKGMAARLASSPDYRGEFEYFAESFLWFIDALSPEELSSWRTPLVDKFKRQLALSLNEIVEPNSPQLRNFVLPNIDTAAQKIDQIRSLKDDVVVVLNHGKWNGFPHLDYALMYHEVMEKLKMKHIKEEDIIFLIAGETNDYMQWVGEAPFLNTAWRLSMMSYLPFDVICSTGQYEPADVKVFWIEAYRRLRPDFLVVDPSDKSGEYKLGQAQEASIETVSRNRSHYLTHTGYVDISHTALGLPIVDGLSLMLFDDEISRLKSEGAFERKANWRNFLTKDQQKPVQLHT